MNSQQDFDRQGVSQSSKLYVQSFSPQPNQIKKVTTNSNAISEPQSKVQKVQIDGHYQLKKSDSQSNKPQVVILNQVILVKQDNIYKIDIEQQEYNAKQQGPNNQKQKANGEFKQSLRLFDFINQFSAVVRGKMIKAVKDLVNTIHKEGKVIQNEQVNCTKQRQIVVYELNFTQHPSSIQPHLEFHKGEERQHDSNFSNSESNAKTHNIIDTAASAMGSKMKADSQQFLQKINEIEISTKIQQPLEHSNKKYGLCIRANQQQEQKEANASITFEEVMPIEKEQENNQKEQFEVIKQKVQSLDKKHQIQEYCTGEGQNQGRKYPEEYSQNKDTQTKIITQNINKSNPAPETLEPKKKQLAQVVNAQDLLPKEQEQQTPVDGTKTQGKHSQANTQKTQKEVELKAQQKKSQYVKQPVTQKKHRVEEMEKVNQLQRHRGGQNNTKTKEYILEKSISKISNRGEPLFSQRSLDIKRRQAEDRMKENILFLKGIMQSKHHFNESNEWKQDLLKTRKILNSVKKKKQERVYSLGLPSLRRAVDQSSDYDTPNRSRLILPSLQSSRKCLRKMPGFSIYSISQKSNQMFTLLRPK